MKVLLIIGGIVVLVAAVAIYWIYDAVKDGM